MTPVDYDLPDESSAATVRARNLRTLALLAALFLLPVVIAFLTYYGTAWRPAGRVNHGHLFTPARPLPAVALPRIAVDSSGANDADTGAAPSETRALRGKWSLVYAGDGACDTACRQALYVARQTRLALGTDMSRLERVFLVTGDCCARSFLAREHPDLAVLDASGPAAQPLLRELDTREPGSVEEHKIAGSDFGRPQGRPEGRRPGTAEAQPRAHALYVVDPLGNLVMSYDARTDLRGMLEDLQKLLRLSHIG